MPYEHGATLETQSPGQTNYLFKNCMRDGRRNLDEVLLNSRACSQTRKKIQESWQEWHNKQVNSHRNFEHGLTLIRVLASL